MRKDIWELSQEENESVGIRRRAGLKLKCTNVEEIRLC